MAAPDDRRLDPDDIEQITGHSDAEGRAQPHDLPAVPDDPDEDEPWRPSDEADEEDSDWA